MGKALASKSWKEIRKITASQETMEGQSAEYKRQENGFGEKPASKSSKK